MSTSSASAKSINELPSPNGLPLVGNLFQIDLSKFHQQLEKWCNNLGLIFKIKMGSEVILCVADKDAINLILRDRPSTWRRRRTIENVGAEMGINGVFASEGERWERQRKIVALALSRAHLNQFFPKMLKTTERLMRRWKVAADSGESVDLCRDVMRYTVDITTELAFGVNVNTLETDGPVIQQQLDKVFPIIHARMNAPFPYWRYFRLAKDRELERAIAGIEKTVNNFITDCRQQMRNQPERYEAPTNFLEAIIAAQTADQGDNFSDAEIYGNVVTLLLAGEDTTAITIAWACNYFMEFPQHLERVRAELDLLCGTAQLLGKQEQLAQLPYLDAFVNETMRLKPIAPLHPVEANEDTEILGYQIPKGTPVICLTRHSAINPLNFSLPETFQPERWLRSNETDVGPHNTQASIPFGAGPRFCPGRNLALAEIKMALAMLCRNFDMTPTDPSKTVEEKFAFVMSPTNLMVRFSHRV